MQRAVSRRRFLGTAGAVAGGLAGWTAATGHPSGGRPTPICMAAFPLGIQSYSLRAFALDTAMEIIHEDLGLHFVEMTGLSSAGRRQR